MLAPEDAADDEVFVLAPFAAVAAKDAKSAKAFLNDAFAAWDKAAKTGIVHWRAASRKKSRLASRVDGLAAAKA